MKKANKEHPVYVSLRDWSKVRKANSPVIAERKEAYHDQNRKDYHRNS